MNAHVRLRAAPKIAFEPDEGQRLRETKAGEDRPWSEDIYDVQMRAKVAVTLVEDVFQNLRALEDLHQIKAEVGIDELVFQIHELKRTAEALQPN